MSPHTCKQKYFKEIIGGPRLEKRAETLTLNMHKMAISPVKDPEPKLLWVFNSIIIQ